jgi:hypothetical protein
MLFRSAVQALQSAEPDAAQLTASARRVADRLGMDGVDHIAIDFIESCDDVQRSFTAYRTGALSPARSLLIEAHMSDCGVCRHRYQTGSAGALVDWSAPRAKSAFVWRPRAFGWTLATASALLVSALFVYKAFWQIPPGVRAQVESIDGAAYRISGAGDRPLAPGDELAEGEQVRTSGGGMPFFASPTDRPLKSTSGLCWESAPEAIT